MATDAHHVRRTRGDGEPLLVRLTRQLEDAGSIDGWDRPLRSAAEALNSSSTARRWLQGHGVGHAVHPVLTDIPIGCWTSATIVDLLAGRKGRGPARQLTGVGLLAAAPTVVTGLSEWGETAGSNRRVGFVHAVSNVVAFSLYAGSWAARGRGRHRMGVGLGLAGGLCAATGGYLGSHLALARKVGSRNPAFAEPA